jgi:folylpolyglutamate synthase/dihydropteroate synthase
MHGERAASPEEILLLAKQCGIPAETASSLPEGLERATVWQAEAPERVLCVTGSLHLFQEIESLPFTG